MTDYTDVCYNNSCLKQVIVRLDFFGYVQLEHLMSDFLQKTIKTAFPNVGLQQLVRFGDLSINLSSAGEPIENKVVLGNRLTYSDNENNKLHISNKSIVFQINKYDSFDYLKQKICPIIESLFNVAQSLSIIRSGLRYVNIFNVEGIRPLKKYFNNQVASSLESLSPSSLQELEMTRKICLAEFRTTDLFVNFRYGYINPDYPQTLRKEDFTLDYDCFKKEQMISAKEVFDFIDEGHYYVQKLFENSITDSLREAIKN